MGDRLEEAFSPRRFAVLGRFSGNVEYVLEKEPSMYLATLAARGGQSEALEILLGVLKPEEGEAFRLKVLTGHLPTVDRALQERSGKRKLRSASRDIEVNSAMLQAILYRGSLDLVKVLAPHLRGLASSPFAPNRKIPLGLSAEALTEAWETIPFFKSLEGDLVHLSLQGGRMDLILALRAMSSTIEFPQDALRLVFLNPPNDMRLYQWEQRPKERVALVQFLVDLGFSSEGFYYKITYWCGVDMMRWCVGRSDVDENPDVMAAWHIETHLKFNIRADEDLLKFLLTFRPKLTDRILVDASLLENSLEVLPLMANSENSAGIIKDLVLFIAKLIDDWPPPPVKTCGRGRPAPGWVWNVVEPRGGGPLNFGLKRFRPIMLVEVLKYLKDCSGLEEGWVEPKDLESIHHPWLRTELERLFISPLPSKQAELLL